ncbi:MAG: hypothetical protein HKN43_03195 [Rhodothermales bacterium]|nr:hypothetical protein [Rhodothermales bacterium]
MSNEITFSDLRDVIAVAMQSLIWLENEGVTKLDKPRMTLSGRTISEAELVAMRARILMALDSDEGVKLLAGAVE